MKHLSFDISVEDISEKSNKSLIAVKMSCDIVEINVYLNALDVENLTSFNEKKQSYCIAGKSVNANVHWKNEGGEFYILVGDDQEIWDICLLVQPDVVSEVISEIGRLS